MSFLPQHVPGTSRFSKDPNDAAAEIYEGVDLNLLKHGRGKHSKIILVPQPSDDPNVGFVISAFGGKGADPSYGR